MASSVSSGQNPVDGRDGPSVSYRLGRILTPRELAGRLGVSRRTVQDWIYKRRVPYTKLCGRIYFSEEVVEGLLAANAVAPRPSSQPQVSVERKEVRCARRVRHE